MLRSCNTAAQWCDVVVRHSNCNVVGLMLKTAKRGALHVLNGLRLPRYVRDSVWRRRRLLILCYHGISLDDEHEWDSTLYMSPAEFEGRLRSIQRSGCTVLPLRDALEGLYGNDLREPTVAITFDDGLYDFISRAHPLLEKYGFPATVYLTTYYCERQQPVFPSFCSYVLWKGRDAVLDAAGILDLREQWDLRTAAGRAAAFESIIGFADRRCLTAEQKTELAEAVARRLGLDYESLVAKRILHLLNPREVTQLALRGVDFQLHTHRHYGLPDRALFLREIHENRERIRAMVGSEPTHFCYPCGYYEREWLAWLGEAGVAFAATSEPGLASPRAHPLLLPRVVDTRHLAPVEFEAWLGGVGALLPRRARQEPERPISEQVRVARAISRRADSVFGRRKTPAIPPRPGRAGPLGDESRRIDRYH
jgi:peptidoglycan/xylan/chitin deacetylase (PgdA/CDA1 family)